MTKSDIHTLIHTLSAVAIVLLFLALIVQKNNVETIELPVEVRDTITVEKERIVEHTNVRYVTKFDTIVKYMTDTDTIEVPVYLPIEHCLYSDTISTDTTTIELGIKYSGFKPSLDSIGINYHYIGEKAVEVKKRPFKRFVGIGAYGGCGVGYDFLNKNVALGPSVGVAIVWGFGYTY